MVAVQDVRPGPTWDRCAGAAGGAALHGERLDLDYAICTCLANEKVRAGRQADRDSHNRPGDNTARPGIAIFNPETGTTCFASTSPNSPGPTGQSKSRYRNGLTGALDRRTRLHPSPDGDTAPARHADWVFEQATMLRWDPLVGSELWSAASRPQ